MSRNSALPNTHGTRIPAYLRLRIIKIIILPITVWRAPVYVSNSHPRLLGVKNYLNNYFAYKCLDELPYTRGTRIPYPLGVKNYLNNYLTMYKRLARFRICVELASPVYLELKII